MNPNLDMLLILRKNLIKKYNVYCKRLKNNPKDTTAKNKAFELITLLSDLDQQILILKKEGVKNEHTANTRAIARATTRERADTTSTSKVNR